MEVDGFLRWRLFWRFRLAAEELLGRPSMMVLAAVAGALIGLALLGPEHAHVVPVIMRHGHEVVEIPGTTTAPFWASIGGGALGVIACFLFALLRTSAKYLFWGDDTWKAIYDEGNFELRCKAKNPVHIRDLGAVECRIKTPHRGTLSSHGTGALMMREQPAQGYIARFDDLPKEKGKYRVRWYAMNGKRELHEIARITTRIVP